MIPTPPAVPSDDYPAMFQSFGRKRAGENGVGEGLLVHKNKTTAEEMVRLNQGGRKALTPRRPEGEGIGDLASPPANSSKWGKATQKDMDISTTRYFINGTTRNSEEFFVDNSPNFAFLSGKWWRPAGKSSPRMPQTARLPTQPHAPVAQVSERLLRSHQREKVPLPALVPSIVMDAENEGVLVKRLYDVEMQRQGNNAVALRKKYETDLPRSAKIDDMQDYADRLMYRPLKAKQQFIDTALAPYRLETSKKLTRAAQEALNARQFTTAVQTREDKRKKCEKMYIHDVAPVFRKMNTEERDQTTKRLAEAGAK